MPDTRGSEMRREYFTRSTSFPEAFQNWPLVLLTYLRLIGLQGIVFSRMGLIVSVLL